MKRVNGNGLLLCLSALLALAGCRSGGPMTAMEREAVKNASRIKSKEMEFG